MKKKSFWTFLVFSLICLLQSNETFAQRMQVMGTVVSTPGFVPIMGVKVTQEGTTNGTITNIDGQYALLPITTGGRPFRLVYEYLGYITLKVELYPTAGTTIVDVIMFRDESLYYKSTFELTDSWF